jgi:hypothetical protein
VCGFLPGSDGVRSRS